MLPLFSGAYAAAQFHQFLGGAAAFWPLVARAQQTDRVRRIGLLLNFTEDDPEAKERVAAFRQGLEKRGWSENRNVHLDYRFTSVRTERISPSAKELFALRPEVILAHSTACAAALQHETSTVPLVFVNVSDPVGLQPRRGLPDRAATSPACCTSRRASSANGWQCSRRLLHASQTLRCWEIRKVELFRLFPAIRKIRNAVGWHRN